MTWDVILFGDVTYDLSTRPMGMYRLANHLRGLGYRSKCLWIWKAFNDKFFNLIASRHVNKDTLIIGISATVLRTRDQGQELPFGLTVEEFNKRCRLLKTLAPQAKLVVGGGQIPYIDQDLLRQLTEVDYFVSGQGESILAHMVDSVKNKRRIQTHDFSKPPIIKDSFMPFEHFHLSQDLWQPEDAVLLAEPLPLELARGCIFRCKFCSYDLTNKKIGDFTKSADNLIAELRHNHDKWGVQHYAIMDDLLNDSTEKVDLIYDVAQRLDFPISFVGYARLDLIRRHPNNLRKLKDIGFYGGFFGIETIDDKNGKAIAKNIGRRRIQEGLDVVYDLYGDNFFGQAGMILGLPNDTQETKNEILDWAMTPKVARVLKRFSIQDLSISTKFGQSDIDHDPASFGYTILGAQTLGTRAGTDRWRTDRYNSDLARQDAVWIREALQKHRPLQQSLDVWQLPMAAYLYGDRQEFLDRANGLISADRSIIDNLKIIETQKRKEYIKTMENYL